MSLLNIFEVAGSGMNAQNVRLNATASNIANAASVASSPEEAYKARQPVFSSLLNEQLLSNSPSVPVNVVGIVESQAEHQQRYEPSHPMANEEGFVWQSNVDVIEEMTNMMVASRNYENNIEMLNTAKEMLLRTMRLGE